MATLQEIFEDLTVADGPAPNGNPFNLASRAESGCRPDEIRAAWPGTVLPGEVQSLWLASRESWLFEDVDYGQWGLHLLSPAGSAARTAAERSARPNDVLAYDIVVGEFLGDSELLIYAPSEECSRVLVALPLDARTDWYMAGASVLEVIRRYAENGGEKYWERDTVVGGN